MGFFWVWIICLVLVLAASWFGGYCYGYTNGHIAGMGDRTYTLCTKEADLDD